MAEQSSAVPALERFGRFNLVGALGIVVQLAVLAVCVRGLAMHYLVGIVLAVPAAVLHNFLWHWGWTWKDRAIPARVAPQALLRFAMANGTVSLTGHLVLMPWLVGAAGLPVEPANLLATAVLGLLNFYLGDRLVFRAGRMEAMPIELTTAGRSRGDRSVRLPVESSRPPVGIAGRVPAGAKPLGSCQEVVSCVPRLCCSSPG